MNGRLNDLLMTKGQRLADDSDAGVTIKFDIRVVERPKIKLSK